MKALITGASSGIGLEIAKYLGYKGYDLILVARSEEKLEKITNTFLSMGINCTFIVCDLSKRKSAFNLYNLVKDLDIDFVVNNAGFGTYGKFTEVPLEKELELINVNIRALHILTKLFVKDMVKRDSGYILNVGSSAGFLPGPNFSSYYASKNYVVALSEAVSEELRRDKSNVSISVLCPGPVDTNFNNVADVNFSMKGLSAKKVAKLAVDKTLKKKMVIIPGALMKGVITGSKLLPERLKTYFTYDVQSKKADR